MKKFLTISLLLFLILIGTTQSYAEECNGYSEAQCINTGCTWTIGCCTCPEQPPTQSFGTFSSITERLNKTIGIKDELYSVGAIINALLPYVLTLSGLVLFAMLIMGGFTMLTAVSDPKKAEAGKQQITTAIAGFIIIFCAYWLTQILEIVLGITIL